VKRNLESVGAAGFEPTTLGFGGLAAGSPSPRKQSQRGGIDSTMTAVSNPAAAITAKFRYFATPLLQESEGGGARSSRRKPPRYLTIREAAAVLRVCTATVYRLCERGELPHLRVSNAIRVLASDLAATVNRRAGRR
jgi:excisionase family DNA binding protein